MSAYNRRVPTKCALLEDTTYTNQLETYCRIDTTARLITNNKRQELDLRLTVSATYQRIAPNNARLATQ